MSLLTRIERSLWSLIVFAFSLDKESFFEKYRTKKKQFSFLMSSLRVFPLLTWCLERRLKPCPRKATVRREKHMHLLRSLYLLRRLKATTLFGGMSKRSPSSKTYEKSLIKRAG